MTEEGFNAAIHLNAITSMPITLWLALPAHFLAGFCAFAVRRGVKSKAAAESGGDYYSLVGGASRSESPLNHDFDWKNRKNTCAAPSKSLELDFGASWYQTLLLESGRFDGQWIELNGSRT